MKTLNPVQEVSVKKLREIHNSQEYNVAKKGQNFLVDLTERTNGKQDNHVKYTMNADGETHKN